MKKIVVTVFSLVALFTACKQQADKLKIGRSEIEKQTDSATKAGSEVEMQTLDYLYKSNNGEIIAASYFTANDQVFIKIKKGDQAELVLEQTATWTKGAEYGKENYKWISENEQATFLDGNQKLELVLISPLRYTFTNDSEDIIITYFDKNDKRFVSIERANQGVITLRQANAWAKGAEYGDYSIQWRAYGNEGILIENGKESTYKEKK